MDVIVKDANGNTLYRSNLPEGTPTAQWDALTGYGVESAAVSFTADYVVVALDLQDADA